MDQLAKAFQSSSLEGPLLLLCLPNLTREASRGGQASPRVRPIRSTGE
jgi:hypothetical protein